MNNAQILDDEIVCDLQCEGLLCLQKKQGYGFTTDAILLANFVKCESGDKCVEFCSGSGVISILVNAKQPCVNIDAVEIQANLATMCDRTLKMNGISGIKVVNMPLEKYADDENNRGLDVVFANPPYYKMNSGKLPLSPEIQIAKHEILTNLESIVLSAKKVLKRGGKFYIVHMYSRLKEIEKVLKKNGFCISKKCEVKSTATKQPHIVLIEAICGVNELNSNAENVMNSKQIDLKPVIIRNADGTFTKQLTDIYAGKYNWE